MAFCGYELRVTKTELYTMRGLFELPNFRPNEPWEIDGTYEPVRKSIGGS